MKKRACFPIFIYLVASLSCSHGFSLMERWEGWADTKARIYVQVREDDAPLGQDDANSEIESADDAVYIRLAAERAAGLSAQAGVAASYGIGVEADRPDMDYTSGRVVYKKCDDSMCEAFVDFPLKRPEK